MNSDNSINFLPIGRRADISANSLGLSLLTKNLLNSSNQSTIFQFRNDGYFSKSIESIFKTISDNGGFVVYEGFDISKTSYIFGWKNRENSYMDLHVSLSEKDEDLYLEINLLTMDCELYNFIKNYFKDLAMCKTDNAGYVFSIIRNEEGQLAFARLGLAGISLEKENYTNEVIKNYDFVVKDLKSKTPSGRIVILEGAPGCGKTYLTRGLFMDIDNAMFVIIPTPTISSLTGPELLPLLIKQKELYGTRGPIILILEDADQCLVPRAADNISSISALLNLGDGILGSLMDIRIIATTNAKQEKMDPAILRDGRLSKKIEVGYLEYEKACSIYSRLILQKDQKLPLKYYKDTGFGSRNEKHKYSLAEIYKIARNNGWSPPQIKEKNVSQNDNDMDFLEFRFT